MFIGCARVGWSGEAEAFNGGTFVAGAKSGAVEGVVVGKNDEVKWRRLVCELGRGS